MLKIFSFVEGESVFVLPRVCRRWRVICSTLSFQDIKWKQYPMEVEAFVIMLSKFGRIESLNFDLGEKNSDPVDDLIVTKLTEMYSGLKSLDFRGSYDFEMKITNVGITKIGEGCPQLQSLNLAYCVEVTDVGITKIGGGCSQLQSLNLQFCKEVTDVGITKIGGGCPQLQELNLEGCPQLKIKELNLKYCKEVTDSGIANITNACNLTKP